MYKCYYKVYVADFKTEEEAEDYVKTHKFQEWDNEYGYIEREILIEKEININYDN